MKEELKKMQLNLMYMNAICKSMLNRPFTFKNYSSKEPVSLRISNNLKTLKCMHDIFSYNSCICYTLIIIPISFLILSSGKAGLELFFDFITRDLLSSSLVNSTSIRERAAEYGESVLIAVKSICSSLRLPYKKEMVCVMI